MKMTFEMDGCEEIAQQLLRMGENGTKYADALLAAGGQRVREAWVRSAQGHGHVDTGAMVASITMGKPKPTDTGRSVTIYPKGYDGKRRNADKAFILHYGSSRIKPDHWVDDADAEAAQTAPEAMIDLWEHMDLEG